MLKLKIQNITIIILLFISQINFSQNKVKLELNLQKGSEYLAIIKLSSSSEQEVNGEKQIVKKEIDSKYKLKILNSISNNSFYIKLTYLEFQNTYHFNDEIIILNSDSLEKQKLQQQDSLYLNIGKSFNFEISKYGKILSIDSITFINYNKNNTKDLEKIIKTFFISFPKHNLAKNDSWTSKDTIKNDIINIYNKKYIFTKINNNTFVINNIATLNSDKTKFKKVRNLFIFYNISGNENGTISLNKNTCMLNEKKIIQTSSGISEVKYSKNSGVIFSSPLKIKNTISVQTIKINNNEN